MMKTKKKRKSNHCSERALKTKNEKQKDRKKGILIIVFLSFITFVLVACFINYRYKYEQAKKALPVAITGMVDANSAEYHYNRFGTSTLTFSINEINFKIGSSWYNSHTYSMEDLAAMLNTGKEVEITYIRINNIFTTEISNEIIGLRIEDKDCLIAEKGLDIYTDGMRISKNITLITSIILLLFIIIAIWAFM